MDRADYEVGTLESKVELEVNNAIKSLDNLISKIDNVKSVLSSALNINGIKEITQFTNSINKIPNALNEINKVDMTKVDSQFMSLGNTVSSFTTQLKEANTMANSTQTVLQSVISSFNALPSAMSKVEKIDNRQLYNSLSSTSRATGEFSGSLYTSLSNIPQALKEVQNMDLKSLYNSFDSMTRILEPFTTKMNETFKGMTDTITPFIDKVKELNDELGKMSGLAENVGDSADKSITKTKKVIDENNNKDKKIGFLDIGDALKSTIKLGAIYGVLRKGFNIAKDVASANIDMIETTNLFEVQMGKVVDQYGNLDEAQSQYYTKAMKFQNEMNEKLATNKAEMEKYQAMYFGMLDAQLGAKNRDASYMMSENLTKAGYDIASLYNLDVDTAMNKLKSGLAGQIESLRQIGIDVSEASLSRILDEVGIDRSVQQLSYAEKEVARYIAICEQAGKAQGDFARTFEQPANQIRVFQNQLIELKQVSGSFIVNTFGNIIVYANAIIMVIKEIIKAFANLFGYDLDVGGGVSSSLGGVSDTVGDIGSGLGKATKQAKEFKKQLMGFDEINNIEPPTTSGGSGGSGGGGGTVGGIDSKLLDALKEWDNKMDSIRGKAQEIRDKMLEWLGFVRNDDGTWRLGEGLTNFKKILEVVKAIGIAIGAWKVASTVTNLLEKLGVISEGNGFKYAFGFTLAATGLYLLWNGVKHLLNGEVDEFTIIETLAGAGALSAGVATLLKTGGLVKDLKSGLKYGIALSLGITGLETWLDGLKKGDLLQSIIGAFEAGGAVMIAGGGLAVALPVTLALSLIGITKKIDDKIKLDETFWKPLYEKFGFEYTGNDFSWANYKIRLQIGFEVIGDIINNLKEKFSGAWTKFTTWLSEKWNDLKEWFSNLPYNIGTWIGETAEQIYMFFTQTIPNAWTDFWNWIGEKWNDFINWLTGLPSKIWEGLKNIGAKIVDFFTITLPKAWNDFINWIKELPAKFLQYGSDIIQGLINGIKQKWTDFWKTITDFVNNFVQGFKDALGIHSPSTIFQSFGINIMEGLINGISNMIGNFKSKIFEVAGNIQNWFNEKISNIKQIGSNIVSGITNGISSATSGLKKKVQGLAGNVSSWFKSALGIHSPSKVMADLAQYIPMGIAKGIDDNTSYAMKSAKNMAINVSDAVENNTKINPLAKFNNGIKVKTEDFAVDTNQHINYSTIKGQILAQSQINIDENIVDRIAEAVTQSMKNAELNVNIEAKTEEGIIFKKVQNSAREYTMQTGKPAFSY